MDEISSNAVASAPSYAIERHSIDYVHSSERHGRVYDQGIFWFTANFSFMSISVGFVGPAMGLSLGWTTLAATLGLIVGTIFVAFHATQGPIMGLPQMIQSRAQFGYRGVVLPLTATLVNFIGFNTVSALLIMAGLRDLFGADRHLVLAGLAVCSGLLAFYGHDWLHLAFKTAFWISLPLFAILSFAIITGHVPHVSTVGRHFSWVAFGVEFATCASYNLNLAVYVSDYSRYLRRDTPAIPIVTAVLLGAIVSSVWLAALGAWLTIRLGSTDPILALGRAGDAVLPQFGTLIVVVSAVLIFAIMAMSTYSGMLNLVTWLDSLRRVKPTLTIRAFFIVVITVAWVFATVAAGEDAVNALMILLAILMYLLIPWTAINLVDYFFVRRGHYAIKDMFDPNGIYGSWGWKGISAYFIGWLAIIPFAVLPGVYMGPIGRKLQGVDIAWLVSLAAAGCSYYLMNRSFDPARESAAIAASELALEGPLSEAASALSPGAAEALDERIPQPVGVQ